MRLDQEILLGTGSLLVLQLLTAFAAIGLLSRMTPAVAQIMEENVFSLEATEDMLVVLASGAPASEGREPFRDALSRARGNVTDEREEPLVDLIEAQVGGALAGDEEARADVVGTLQQLAAINREQMHELDMAAQRIGRAGAWAAVLLGLVTFLVGHLAQRRLRTRLERPVLEVDATLEAARRGDIHRRCLPLEGPRELERVAANLNWVFDRLHRQDERDGEERLRSLVLHLLDAAPAPMLVVDPQEGLVAMNRAALGLFDRAERQADLVSAIRAGQEPAGWRIEPVGGTGLVVAIGG